MNGLKRSSVFIPGSPIPMSGKLLFIENNKIEKLKDVSTNEAIKKLITIGRLSENI